MSVFELYITFLKKNMFESIRITLLEFCCSKMKTCLLKLVCGVFSILICFTITYTPPKVFLPYQNKGIIFNQINIFL